MLFFLATNLVNYFFLLHGDLNYSLNYLITKIKKMKNKNQNSDSMEGFGALLAALGGGGDKGNTFPQSDADDFSRGVSFIPPEVTDARRLGQKVMFVKECGPCCWYWKMPDGSKIYHFDRTEYENIKFSNNATNQKAGPCPKCGNMNTGGGTVEA